MDIDRWLPEFAHIPGETPRHEEGYFEFLTSTCPQHISFADLQNSNLYTTAVRIGLHRYFWECHELLEPLWMVSKQGSSEKLHLQSLIQLANAGLKARMGRENAVRRLLLISQELHGQACVVNQLPDYALHHFTKLSALVASEQIK
ncbi:DUF309 domain-containing protein [Sneathiella glossodoripedis]|uniref:DUF309 domain-containing protein n=1 Tax=Sneathiella glossodoripedis TaxID=418853 RepID=UPI0004700521|nr:DUF309 domain-containing protein [Sneathiella glossodoripedis]